jgi:sulfatase modifying factor 1
MHRALTRYTPLLLLAIWIALESHAPAHDGHMDKKLIADYVFIPGGELGDSVLPEFYISAIEITNKQYRNFIEDLIDSGATDKVKQAMVDTLQWGQGKNARQPFTDYYYQHPAYNDYPVVNISRRGAELYCEWLTEKYNSAARQKARFSLPTEAQWVYAAQGGNPKAIYPWPGNSLYYQKKGKWYGTRMCNYRVDTVSATSARINDTADITAPSRSFMPNTYEVYNMGGNVAEMVSDQDYTKGGSYLSPPIKILIAAHEDADLSHGHPTIGFRPVMVMELK